MSSPALTSAPVAATRPRGPHGAPVRGRRTGAGVSFILPYLPFLIGFGIAPMIYALVLAFTTSSGGWAGAGNFTRTFKDYRFLPAFEHILLYTGVWLGTSPTLRAGLFSGPSARSPAMFLLPQENRLQFTRL